MIDVIDNTSAHVARRVGNKRLISVLELKTIGNFELLIATVERVNVVLVVIAMVVSVILRINQSTRQFIFLPFGFINRDFCYLT